MDIKRNRTKMIATRFLGILIIWITTLLIHNNMENTDLLLWLAVFLSLCLLISCFEIKAFRKCGELILKYRWAIAGMIFVLLVAFQLSGSSISMFDAYLPTQITNDASTLFGQARAVRSDEWSVQVSTFFSQSYNAFQQTSTQMSISPTNMIMDYFSPVKSILIIAKPFSWGYLFFGNTVGLSWYWSMMVVLLFASSFEMFYILTSKNARISVIGMFMVSLSPAIQWWMMPHMPILIVYSMLIFDAGYYFFTTKHKVMKWLLTLAAIILIPGFVMSIFPSFQIPLLCIVLALLIATLIRDAKMIRFGTTDIIRIGIAVVMVAFLLCYFVLTSWDAIKLVLNSAYPGQRISTGNDQSVFDLFTNLTSILLPYKDSLVSNNCEVADFIHFGPLFVLLFPLITKRVENKKEILIGKVLEIILLVELFYMGFGVSTLFAKLTLFKYFNRMKLIYGFTATVFSVWCIYILTVHPDLLKKWEKITFPIIYGLAYLTLIDDNLAQYMGVKIAIVLIFALVVILLLAMNQKSKLFSYSIIALMVIAGLTVNPIEKGIASLTNHPLYTFVQDKVAEDASAHWFTTDCSFVISNYLLASGAVTLDSTNFYKDEAKWELLDPDGIYEDLTNRYANECATLTADATYIELINPTDYIEIHLNPNDLKKLEITYLVSTVDYTDLLSQYNITALQVFSQDGYTVYQLYYD